MGTMENQNIVKLETPLYGSFKNMNTERLSEILEKMRARRIGHPTEFVAKYIENGNISGAWGLVLGCIRELEAQSIATAEEANQYANVGVEIRADGSIESTCECRNGMAHGFYREYHQNGNLKEETEFADGVRHGKSIRYHNNGIIHIESNYKKGMLDGYYGVWNYGWRCLECFYSEGVRVCDIIRKKGQENLNINISIS